MKDLLRSARAVLVAYFVSELVRSKGLVYGLLSLGVWLSVFVLPATLFVKGDDMGLLATGTLIGYAIFLAYSTATWDWAMLLRWLLQLGIFEYVITSGSPIISHYIGTIPVSAAWYAIALGIAYVIVRAFIGTPHISIVDPVTFIAGVIFLLTVLLAYSFILGGSVIAAGTVGPVVEFISWLLPIATGGMVPVSAIPQPLQIIAYLTPFSYPAELLRYSLGVSKTTLDLGVTLIVGGVYSTLFLALSTAYLRYQINKMLKEGIKTAALI